MEFASALPRRDQPARQLQGSAGHPQRPAQCASRPASACHIAGSFRIRYMTDRQMLNWICNMTSGRRFVAYYRVSTQQEAVQKHVAAVGGELVDAFEEVELNSLPGACAGACCLPRNACDLDYRQARPAGAQCRVPAVGGGGKRAGGVVFCDLPQVSPATVRAAAGKAVHRGELARPGLALVG